LSFANNKKQERLCSVEVTKRDLLVCQNTYK